MIFPAQVNFDDWAEIAIIAVVVIGSFIANAVKSWTQRMEKRSLDEQRERTRQARPMPPVASPGPFNFPPVPAPPAVPRTQSAGPPVERRPPVIARRTIVIETQRTNEPPRLPRGYRTPPPLAQPVDDSQRRLREPRRERADRPPVPPAAPKKRDQERAAAETRARRRAESASAPAAQQRRGDLTDSVAAHEAEMERSMDARIGHVHDGVVAPIPEEEIEVLVDQEIGASAPRVSRLSRRALRDGIILSEILGPPLSVRPSDDVHTV